MSVLSVWMDNNLRVNIEKVENSDKACDPYKKGGSSSFQTQNSIFLNFEQSNEIRNVLPCLKGDHSDSYPQLSIGGYETHFRRHC